MNTILIDTATPPLTPETRSPRSPRCINNHESNDSTSNTSSNGTECSVCLCAFKNDRVELECGHSLHSKCLALYLISCAQKKKMASCPLCRIILNNYKDIDINELIKQYGNVLVSSSNQDAHIIGEPNAEIVNSTEQTRLVLSMIGNVNDNRNTYNCCYCEHPIKTTLITLFILLGLGIVIYFIIKM